MPDLYDIALHAFSHRIPLRDAQRVLHDAAPMYREPTEGHDDAPLFDQSPHHAWNHAEESNYD